MTSNPARWHADPTGRHQLRYWDGRAWTAHVSDRGVAATDPLPAAASSPRTAAQITPSSEGRSTPAAHEPMPAALPSEPARTQPVRAVSQIVDSARELPAPIVTQAGWSARTRLLVAFVALDAIVAAVVIWLVAR
jgi:hypothetical protein